MRFTLISSAGEERALVTLTGFVENAFRSADLYGVYIFISVLPNSTSNMCYSHLIHMVIHRVIHIIPSWSKNSTRLATLSGH